MLLDHICSSHCLIDCQLYTVRVVDTSSDRKTAEELHKHLKSVREDLEKNWGVIVVAASSDAAGESRKGRVLMHQEDPSLVVPDCYSHQVRVVGIYRRKPC